jgi:hypothetical protein
MSARQAVKLCTADVPQLDVHTVGAALAEKEHRHWTSLRDRANKRQNNAKICAFGRVAVGHLIQRAKSRSADKPK